MAATVNNVDSDFLSLTSFADLSLMIIFTQQTFWSIGQQFVYKCYIKYQRANDGGHKHITILADMYPNFLKCGGRRIPHFDTNRNSKPCTKSL